QRLGRRTARRRRFARALAKDLFMKTALTVLLAFACVARAAPRTLAADLDDEKSKLQGTWASTSFEAKGSAKDSRKVTFTFNGDRLKMKVDDQAYDLNY